MRVAHRKLDMLDGATRLTDLAAPPGNRLEALKGAREGEHSIRINDQGGPVSCSATAVPNWWRSSITIEE
jgi:hypothetical protein